MTGRDVGVVAIGVPGSTGIPAPITGLGFARDVAVDDGTDEGAGETTVILPPPIGPLPGTDVAGVTGVTLGAGTIDGAVETAEVGWVVVTVVDVMTVVGTGLAAEFVVGPASMAGDKIVGAVSLLTDGLILDDDRGDEPTGANPTVEGTAVEDTAAGDGVTIGKGAAVTAAGIGAIARPEAAGGGPSVPG